MSGVHIDRIGPRTAPDASPIAYQSWGKLLFMHWPIPAELLRPLIPLPLEIDTFDGTAWIAVVPFTMWDIRPRFLPAVPYLSQAHELNVRTYVHYQGFPGVWFLSLDISQWPGELAGRHLFHLPYYKADIQLEQEHKTIRYDLTRTQDPKPADFNASWTIGDQLPVSLPDSLESFLTDRYCLYAIDDNKLYRARIWHNPWPLQQAKLNNYSSSMIEVLGLPTPTGDPLLHYAESIDMKLWFLDRLL